MGCVRSPTGGLGGAVGVTYPVPQPQALIPGPCTSTHPIYISPHLRHTFVTVALGYAGMHAVMPVQAPVNKVMLLGYNVMTDGACTDGCQAGLLVPVVLQPEG